MAAADVSREPTPAVAEFAVMRRHCRRRSRRRLLRQGHIGPVLDPSRDGPGVGAAYHAGTLCARTEVSGVLWEVAVRGDRG